MTREVTPVATLDGIKTKLDGAVGKIKEAVAEKTGTNTSKDGLLDLAAKVEGLVPQLNGEEREVRVSSAGGIFANDPVTLCREFAPGTPVRFAQGNTKLLATASAPHAGVNAILYTQDGATKLKLFWLTTSAGEPSLRLGNTVVLLEDEALTQGAVCMSPDGKTCYVAYERDGDGMIQVVTTNMTTYASQVTATDIWADGGGPENIVVAAGETYIALCCTRLPQGSTRDPDRKAALLTLHVATDDAGTVSVAIDGEAVLTAATYPALYGMTYSKDSYAHGWAVAVYADTVYLTYPKAGGQGRGILVAALQDSAYIPLGYCDCPVQDSVPSAQLAEQLTQDAYGIAGVVSLAHGVTRLNKAGQTESLLALELWVRQAGDARPMLLALGEEGVRYNELITMVCSGSMGATGGFAGYGMQDPYGGVYRMLGMALELRPDGVVGGPSVEVGTFFGYGAILPGDATHAAYVYELGGSGYIRPLRQRAVASRATKGSGDARALEGGQSGERIRVVLNTVAET